MKKNALRTSSLIAALLGWLLLSALNVFILWALRDRARLVRDNDNERTLNTLWSEMRNYDDFGSAVESNPVLKERIIGVALYENNLRPTYQWGKVPPVFDEAILENAGRNRFGRYTIPNRQGKSAQFVLYFRQMGSSANAHHPDNPPPPEPQRERMFERRQEMRRQTEIRQNPEQRNSLFFNNLAREFAKDRYFYIDISHPDYWRTRTLTAVLLPLVEIALLVLVFYIRRLYLRNREYREKIEGQHNLVVLGTAAGTLAHEIKNPLLSIRLQTGILEKLKGQEGKDEIGIINQEVDRLSALVYRVNDYLREPAGEKAPLNIVDLITETSMRLFGENILSANSESAVLICADEHRIRSVLENILRNAVDSGSPLDDIGASVDIDASRSSGGAQAGNAVIRIFDRGRGIAEKDLKRVFDPFFTTKSTGTGIGLAISKRFTEAAGGTISVANRSAAEGEGLMVTLVFPLYSEDKT